LNYQKKLVLETVNVVRGFATKLLVCYESEFSSVNITVPQMFQPVTNATESFVLTEFSVHLLVVPTIFASILWSWTN